MSYQLKTIKDSPIGFWTLDESSGSIAYDKSGCNNHGTYIASPASNMLPLVPGGISGTKITNTAYATFPVTKDFYSSTVGAGLANKYTSDNDFTLEVWVNQSIESNNETPLFADTTNNILPLSLYLILNSQILQPHFRLVRRQMQEMHLL